MIEVSWRYAVYLVEYERRVMIRKMSENDRIVMAYST